MDTTIPVSKEDHARFVKYSLSHQARLGKRVSSIEFFSKVMDIYEQYFRNELLQEIMEGKKETLKELTRR